MLSDKRYASPNAVLAWIVKEAVQSRARGKGAGACE